MRTILMLLALLASSAMAQDGPIPGDPYVDGDYQAHFVSTQPDGSVTVTIGVPKRDLGSLPPEATREQYIEAVRQCSDTCRDDPACVLMPDDWLPPFDRRLRNAWKKAAHKEAKGNFKDVDEDVRGIEIDMPKARKIWGEKIEQAAVDQLRRENVDVRLAEVRGNTKELEAMKAKRDALFGIMETVTPSLEAAQTPEELMAIWPTELPDSTRPETPTAADKAKAMQERAEAKAEGRKGGNDGNANDQP
jgi:hypothetical protein